jgi:glyoxylase-like metal-dependent hydrolase (beta-lactamase superfamily II)
MAVFDLGLKARALAPGVYVVEGANDDFSLANGCNIINTGFITTGAGVLVINTGTSRLYGEQLRALIARTTPEPVAQVIHLNLHPDYFLGNQAFAAYTAWHPASMQYERGPRQPLSRAATG